MCTTLCRAILTDCDVFDPKSGLGAEDVFASGFQANGGPTDLSASTISEPTPATPLSDLSAMGAALDEDTSPRLDVVRGPVYTEQSEATLMQALLVGNFEVAVNCCLHYNQLADALLLASCGGPDLWVKTQRAFFAHQSRPVMRVVAAIIKNELSSLVEQAELSDWRETLAILSTYAKSEEFPSLCDKLAGRLEAAGDRHSATLCYMCAVNVDKTVAAWVAESLAETPVLGRAAALHRLVEKVSVFSMAVEQPDQSMGSDVAACFAEYSSLVRGWILVGCFTVTSTRTNSSSCGREDGSGGSTRHCRQVCTLLRRELRDPARPYLQRCANPWLPATTVPV
jgi:hypothetical protein